MWNTSSYCSWWRQENTFQNLPKLTSIWEMHVRPDLKMALGRGTAPYTRFGRTSIACNEGRWHSMSHAAQECHSEWREEIGSNLTGHSQSHSLPDTHLSWLPGSYEETLVFTYNVGYIVMNDPETIIDGASCLKEARSPEWVVSVRADCEGDTDHAIQRARSLSWISQAQCFRFPVCDVKGNSE